MSDSRESVQEFGRELINARDYKKISVEQISEITKIDVRYLRAMEQGDWDLLPRPYMKAFLKAYAETVGMNVPKVLKKYREMVQTELVAHPEEDEDEEDAETKPTQEEISVFPSSTKQKIKIIGAAVIALLVVVLLFLFFRSGNDELESAQSKRTTSVPSESTKPEPTPVEVKTEGQSQPEIMAEDQGPGQALISPGRRTPSEIIVVAHALDKCWLQATMDGQRVRDVLLSPGDEITLQAVNELHLVVGNAGGLEMILAGDTLRTLGPPNKPITMVIGPTGIKSQRMGAWQVNFSGEMPSAPGDSVSQDSISAN